MIATVIIIIGLVLVPFSVRRGHANIDNDKGFWPWIVVALVGLVLMWTGLGLME